MRAVITIFKSEFKGKETIKSLLCSICEEEKMFGNAYVYSPAPGKLFQFLNTLKENHIAYGTHFDSSEGRNRK